MRGYWMWIFCEQCGKQYSFVFVDEDGKLSNAVTDCCPICKSSHKGYGDGYNFVGLLIVEERLE